MLYPRYEDKTAMCDLCFEDKPLDLKHWYPRSLEYIREGGTGWFRCKACTEFHSKNKKITKKQK